MYEVIKNTNEVFRLVVVVLKPDQQHKWIVTQKEGAVAPDKKMRLIENNELCRLSAYINNLLLNLI